MGREIYMRDPSDPYYKSGILEVNDEIETLIGHIKMMLFTNKGEIIGAPDFGASLDEQLFTNNVNEYSLRSNLEDQTLKFIPLAEKYQVQYDIKFARGTVRDICLIDVLINGRAAFGVSVA